MDMDNAVLEALLWDKLGVRITFQNSEHSYKSDVILTCEEAELLNRSIKASLDAIEKIKDMKR